MQNLKWRPLYKRIPKTLKKWFWPSMTYALSTYIDFLAINFSPFFIVYGHVPRVLPLPDFATTSSCESAVNLIYFNDITKFNQYWPRVLEFGPIFTRPRTPLYSQFHFLSYRICMKYISLALDRLKTKDLSQERDLSLVERILVSESDTKLACVFALDLILVGIDTVIIQLTRQWRYIGIFIL